MSNQKLSLGVKHVSDKELVQKSVDGSISAFEEFIKRNQRIIASTAINMLGNSDDAEEVGQETFIRFYKNLSKFRGDSKVSTYLVRICLNRLKRNQLYRIRIVSIGLTDQIQYLKSSI